MRSSCSADRSLSFMWKDRVYLDKKKISLLLSLLILLTIHWQTALQTQNFLECTLWSISERNGGQGGLSEGRGKKELTVLRKDISRSWVIASTVSIMGVDQCRNWKSPSNARHSTLGQSSQDQRGSLSKTPGLKLWAISRGINAKSASSLIISCCQSSRKAKLHRNHAGWELMPPKQQEQWGNCYAHSSITVLMLPEHFLVGLFESMVFKHSFFSIPFGPNYNLQ